MSHTPGPYSLLDWYAPGGSGFEIEAGEQTVGQVYHQTDRAEELANARLFAAAPDLLAACEAMAEAFSADEMQLSILMIGGVPIQQSPELVARCDRVRKAHEMRRAAIAKAKGETP